MRRLFAGMLILGGLINGAAVDAVPPSTTCAIEDATLDWGFKESFRAYIDGSIANGEWVTADGASYETPLFAWSSGAGAITPHVLTGEVSFIGSVRFTGHGGILDTTIANPVIRFDDNQHATLLLDVSGATMEGDPYAETAVSFVEVDLSGVGVVSRRDGVVIVDTAPTTLTAEGAVAFPNYEVGSEFDPVSLEFTVGPDCDLDGGLIGDPTPFVVVIGAIAGAIILTVVVLIVVRIRRQ